MQGDCEPTLPMTLVEALDKSIPLGKFNPRQCLILTARPFLSVTTAPAKFWLDNLFIRYRAEFTTRNQKFFFRGTQISLGGFNRTDAYVTRSTIQDGLNAGNGFNIGTSSFALFHGEWATQTSSG
jgi:hypothetical protein